ncbi:MAG TPA: hypothetical protein VJ550_00455 [Geomonas sp.]|nr:hypothetical protein [Geomonas sp.]
MANRARSAEKSGGFDYRIMEVRLRKKNAPPDAKEELRFLMVDSSWETLRFVQENMEDLVGNIVRLKRSERCTHRGVNESAALFKRNLEPLMSSLAASKGEGVMDKLSLSLKKALLLLVMERYRSDRDQACKVLGITREKLDNELVLCGVAR